MLWLKTFMSLVWGPETTHSIERLIFLRRNVSRKRIYIQNIRKKNSTIGNRTKLNQFFFSSKQSKYCFWIDYDNRTQMKSIFDSTQHKIRTLKAFEFSEYFLYGFHYKNFCTYEKTIIDLFSFHPTRGCGFERPRSKKHKQH